MSDIDTVVVNSLKALDPEWPIREADITDALAVGLRNLPGSEPNQAEPELLPRLVD